LISACLFGDGAVCGGVDEKTRCALVARIEWKAAGSTLSPEDRDYLRFEQRNGMLRNILARQVPALAAKHAERVLSEIIVPRGGISRNEITAWIMHAGGRDVLVTMQERLRLTEHDLR